LADLQPVRPPRSGLEGHGALAATIVVILILAAMIKPWGGSGGLPPATLFPSAPTIERPSGDDPAAPAPSPSGFDLRYRAELFGGPEPLPGWGIWPAGYLVTFGFAAPVPPVASAKPGPSVRPDRTATPSMSAAGPRGAALQWPVRFDVSEGSHLLVLGINTPLGYDVSRVDLRRYTREGTLVPVGIEQLPSPWPDHFTVIGIRSRATDGHLEVWPTGRYRLDWMTDPGAIGQSIEIRILPLPADDATP
jgi:hypothetical protein